MPSVINEHTQYLDSSGTPIASGSVYIGTVNLNPVTNPITIYSDRDLTTSISNPQTLDADGRTTSKIWVPGKYSIRVDDSSGVQQYQELDVGSITETGITILDTVAGTNTITASGATETVTALTDGQQYNFKAANANTGAVTLQIDATAAKSIKKYHDEDLASGDIEQNQVVSVVYNSTDDVFELVSNSAVTTYPITLTSPQTLTSTSVDVTGIPSGVKRVTVMLFGAEVSGSADFLIQLGDSGGIETTGYDSSYAIFQDLSGTPVDNSGDSTTGFISADGLTNGSYTFYLQDSSNYRWIGQSSFFKGLGTVPITEFGAGVKALSGELTQVRITTSNGTDTLSGDVSIQYES